MRRGLTASTLLAAVVFAAPAWAAKAVVSDARVREIAAMLGQEPAGFGRPIDDRAAWDALRALDAYKAVVRSAERVLKQPLPDSPDDLYLDFSRTGNRTRWQRVSGKRRDRVTPYVLAECVENKGRFLPPFEALVRELCKERTWVMPAHDRGLSNFHGKATDIDLASSALAWQFATAHYLLGPRLSEATQELIRSNLERRVLQPFRDMATGRRKGNWWTRCTNNWNAVCLAGVTGAALALVEDREDRALFVAAAEVYSKNFLKGFTPDGYCSEGLGYWNYGFGHYVYLSEAVHQATAGQVDLLALDKVRAPATFGARIEIANAAYPAFADCSLRARPDSHLMNFISRRYRLGLRRWERSPMATAGGSLATSMMYSLPNSASSTPPADNPGEAVGPRSWFQDASVLICRPGSGTDCRLAAALKGGHNGEHHNHNDVGSYVVVVGSDTVLADPGSEVYSGRTFSKQRYVSKVLNSYGHPVPVLAGHLQPPGRQYRARVLETSFTDSEDTLVLDLAGAYRVPGLEKLRRTFRYSRQGTGSLTVTDEVVMSRPQTFGTALITFGRHQIAGHGSLTIYGSDEAVRVEVEASGSDFEIKPEQIKENLRGKSYPTRLGIELSQPVSSAVVTVTVRPLIVPGEQAGGLRNAGFEHRSWGWNVPSPDMGSVTEERAASGKRSLKITDDSKTQGSSITSARVDARGGRAFELRGKVFPESGSKGLGLYVRFLDSRGTMLNKTSAKGHISPVGSVGGATRRWESFAFPFEAPQGTAHMQLWIHSYTGARVTAYLDDLVLAPVSDQQRE